MLHLLAIDSRSANQVLLDERLRQGHGGGRRRRAGERPAFAVARARHRWYDVRTMAVQPPRHVELGRQVEGAGT